MVEIVSGIGSNSRKLEIRLERIRCNFGLFARSTQIKTLAIDVGK